MSLDDRLCSLGVSIVEGHSREVSQQIEDLTQIVSAPNLNVMEIGFNAGHSAEIFLRSGVASLTSFDIGLHSYVEHGKKFIDEKYPNKHQLILGDSTKTVPEFIKNNPTTKFDVIFIDGGHDYEIAKADMENCFHLAHKDTIIVMDDTMYIHHWAAGHTIGPTRTWIEYLQKGKIVELNHRDYFSGRGMSWGKYVM